MNLELTKDELEYLLMLLKKEDVGTRVEIHHADRSFEYRAYLKNRDKMISDLLTKIKEHSLE
jgi:hypothetical protein